MKEIGIPDDKKKPADLDEFWKQKHKLACEYNLPALRKCNAIAKKKTAHPDNKSKHCKSPGIDDRDGDILHDAAQVQYGTLRLVGKKLKSRSFVFYHRLLDVQQEQGGHANQEKQLTFGMRINRFVSVKCHEIPGWRVIFAGLKYTAKIGLVLFLIFCFLAAPGQAKKDTTIILISNIVVQLEATQALNDMYNFKFEKAEQQFRWFKQRYAWHPLPYFLLGLSAWWKIMPSPENRSHDERFLSYMDSTIMVAERLHSRSPEYRIEAAFFLAAAYGFKGRLYSDDDRKEWRKAAVAGKRAMNYLEECKEKEYLSPELLFGDALYNYFSVWVRENYPALKPLLWFFPKGDKELGLKQLREVSFNAFYTRTEAMVWLMRIYNSYENQNEQATQLATYLFQTYPDNAYFHRYYARMLYTRGMYTDMERESKAILMRIDSGHVGYEATSGRYASFFLGQLGEVRKNRDDAKKYYLQTVMFSEQTGATKSGYYLYSLIALGEIASKEGDKALAKKYFEDVKKKADRKDEAFKDAKRRLKNLDKGD